MFICEKKTKNKKTGKVYIKHVLMQSVRDSKRVSHRTIKQLGRLTLPKNYWNELATELECRLQGQPKFELKDFKCSQIVLKVADKIMQTFNSSI